LLLHDLLYYVLVIVTLILTWYRLTLPYESKIKVDDVLKGMIVDITLDDTIFLLIDVGNNELIKASYDPIILGEFSYQYGDIILFKGEELPITSASVPYGYDNKKVLAKQHIYHQLNLVKMIKVKSSFSIIKNFVYHRLNTLSSSRKYVTTFILGKNQLNSVFKYRLQCLGISHLFAISGMHISLLCKVLLWLLKHFKVKEGYRVLIMGIFLFIYFYLTRYTPSLLRSGIFTLLLAINKLFYFHIKQVNLLLLSLVIILLWYPSYITLPALQFSFVTSFFLLSNLDKLKKGTYFHRLVKTSLISYVSSLPIVLYYGGSSNFLSFLYNLLFVPLVSFILFPLCLLTFCFPQLDGVTSMVIHWFEGIVHCCSSIKFGEIIIGRPSLWMILLYFLFLLLAMYRKKVYLFFAILLFVGKYFYVDTSVYFMMIDVGQGDCFLFHDGKENILLDTGGSPFAKTPISLYQTLPLLKKLGIKKLDHLILSHGDDDHLGDSFFLLENYPIDNVFINQGTVNKKEQQLIDLYHAKVMKQDFLLATKNITFQQLNKVFSDENDASMVFLISTFSKYLLFTGDASVKTEEYILSTYRLPWIDILKLGHHGSRTSTSKLWLETLKPKLTLISAGVDNRFNHPHKEVLARLEEYQIPYLLTSEVGSVKIDLKNGTITSYLS